MKTFTSLLVVVTTIGAVRSSPILEERAATPYQPTGCYYIIEQGGSSCGGKGTLKTKDPLGGPRTVPTANGCTDLCFSQSLCKSYAYTASTKTCQIYGKTLAQQGFKPATTGSIAYYNRACFKKACECNNYGIVYGVFNDDSTNTDSQADYYATWDPVATAGQQGLFVGNSHTQTLGFTGVESSPGVTIYGTHFDTSNGTSIFAVNHWFYLHPSITGTYSLAISEADDIADVWTGSTAYSGWTRQNAALENNYTSGTKTLSIAATAGQYVPMRIVYGQGLGPYTLAAQLTDPTGNVILDGTTSAGSQIQQFSCDDTTAPAFPPFD